MEQVNTNCKHREREREKERQTERGTHTETDRYTLAVDGYVVEVEKRYTNKSGLNPILFQILLIPWIG